MRNHASNGDERRLICHTIRLCGCTVEWRWIACCVCLPPPLVLNTGKGIAYSWCCRSVRISVELSIRRIVEWSASLSFDALYFRQRNLLQCRSSTKTFTIFPAWCCRSPGAECLSFVPGVLASIALHAVRTPRLLGSIRYNSLPQTSMCDVWKS